MHHHSIQQCEEETIKLLKNPDEQMKLRERGEKHVLAKCGWEFIAKNWIEMFETTYNNYYNAGEVNHDAKTRTNRLPGMVKRA